MTSDDSAATHAARLLIGPLLRYVDAEAATVWVETDRPCTVRVLDVSAPTWSVHGHHYALLVLTGLAPGTETAYQVHLDDRQVWPLPGNPPSLIRTFLHEASAGEPRPAGADPGFRLAFGSCRRSAGDDPASLREFGADALVALSRRMQTEPTAQWPDAMFLGGDQVYADLPSPALLDRLRARHEQTHPDDPDWAEVADEIQDFEEYTWLYLDSWTRPDVRWLLSTVPTMMLLDDHDLRDDWNTSDTWRREVSAKPWWRQRVTGAFASYWVYQHLGNLSPRELADDAMFAMVRTVSSETERSERLDEFAWNADAHPESARWSFRRDFGDDGLRVRFVAVDSRCSRQLDPARRAILDDREHEWLTGALHGDPVDHLLVGATLPLLVVPGLHHLEGWNEALAGGRYGRFGARLAERMRQVVDLEHWSAFRRSFTRVMTDLAEVGRREHAPASILLLSGDVHCSYVATGQLPGVDPGRTTVRQLTMSPFRNPLEQPIRLANRLLSRTLVRNLLRRMADAAGVARVPAEWTISHGLWFDNGVMTVTLKGRQARLHVDHAHVDRNIQVLRRTLDLPLTDPVDPTAPSRHLR